MLSVQDAIGLTCGPKMNIINKLINSSKKIDLEANAIIQVRDDHRLDQSAALTAVVGKRLNVDML